jgi:sterol desaturase/sphingolipid hydroxylase (fatty acid hydroxylase superfamily)
MRFSSFWIYPCASLVLISLARSREPERSVADYLILILCGIILWTLIEYGLHRFFFHWHPGNRSLAHFVSGFHLVHHGRPRDPNCILARSRTTLPLSAIILGLTYGTSGSTTTAVGIATGVWVGFLYYEWVHYRVHTSGSTFGLEGHRSRHFRHHFVDDRKCFGVTSPLWDFVFGTYLKKTENAD